MKKIFLLLSVVWLSACHKPNSANLAEPWQPDYDVRRSEASIINFEQQDNEKMPAPGGIVFTGSSSFTKWQSAGQDLAPLPIINRGFGGSTFPEVIYYAPRNVLKYNPKTIVTYCENDMFGKKPKTPEQVRDEYVTFVKLVRAKLPDVQLYFVSLKPSPSRWAKKDDVIKANQLVQDYIKKDKNHHYIDVWPVMLKNGRPDGSIFVSDSLHMNDEGYRRWTAVFKPVLEKAL